MIYKEIAIDPGVLSSWGRVRYLIEKFDWECGRILSVCPKKWKKAIMDNSFKPMERQKVVEKLRQLNSVSVERSTDSFNGLTNWLECVTHEHAANPFTLIVSDNSGASVNAVGYDDLNDDSWAVDGGVVPRNAEDFAREVSLLLKSASKVLFVDPHFEESEARFVDPLKCFIRATTDSFYKRKAGLEFELHIKLNSPSYNQEDYNRANVKVTNVLHRLNRQLAHDVNVYVWREKEGGEGFHNRYILTDKSGVSFGTGLDVCTDAEHSQTDDVNRLTRSQYIQRFNQFCETSAVYDLLKKAIIQ